jgi:hypothetical protein
VDPKGVVNVLRNMIGAVRPGGTIVDLQVIRPNPRVELDEELICEIDGRPLFAKADPAARAINAAIAGGQLTDEAADDHDVRTHYPSGADLIDDFADKLRELPEDALPLLAGITHPLVVRERCRLRRLLRV